MKPKTRVISTTIIDTTVLVGYMPDEPQTADELAAMPYHDYLETPEWRERRRQAIDAAEHRCQSCGRYDLPLQVHHLTYERRGNEHPDDLVALCEPCHRETHGLR